VLLCDDSSSMSSPILEEGKDPFAIKKSTRWLELKKLAAVLIEIVTAINPSGFDLYFLNREKHCNVNNMTGLQSIFAIPPKGDTQITRTINQIYGDKKDVIVDRQLLIIVITDGEPNDGTKYARSNLFNTLKNLTDKGNIHISFAECTDQEEDMEYLDQWDNKLKNFDYTDYVIKILLATFIKSYFNLDQNCANRYNNNKNDYCCIII